MAFLDPPKPSAKEAIQNLENSGVAIKILTGDNEFVTKKICEDIRLNVSQIILGEQIAKMTDAELIQTVKTAVVFARVLPLQKQRIIKAVQSSGFIVGFLGDGINDAPALKSAERRDFRGQCGGSGQGIGKHYFIAKKFGRIKRRGSGRPEGFCQYCKIFAHEQQFQFWQHAFYDRSEPDFAFFAHAPCADSAE